MNRSDSICSAIAAGTVDSKTALAKAEILKVGSLDTLILNSLDVKFNSCKLTFNLQPFYRNTQRQRCQSINREVFYEQKAIIMQ
jgi:hypothetical protein